MAGTTTWIPDGDGTDGMCPLLENPQPDCYCLKAGLLLPEADQPEHPQGRALLPARLPGLPHLPALHGDRRFLKSSRRPIIILLSRSMNVHPSPVFVDGTDDI